VVDSYASETWTLTKRDRKQLNIFERKVYRRILGLAYNNEKENWRILTNKEIYASVKNPTIVETIRLWRHPHCSSPSSVHTPSNTPT